MKFFTIAATLSFMLAIYAFKEWGHLFASMFALIGLMFIWIAFIEGDKDD